MNIHSFDEALERKIAADPEAAAAEYAGLRNTDGGRILNTDEARELSPDYRADRTRSADVHEPASTFIKSLYASKLDGPVGKGNARVVSLDSIPSVEEHGLEERVRNALNTEHAAGGISDKVKAGVDPRRAATAREAIQSSGMVGQDRARDGGQSESQRVGGPLSDEARSTTLTTSTAVPGVNALTLASWLDRIASREARIGIVGLGYVGLPLTLLFCEERFRVTGFDIDAAKVDALNAGRSYIQRITPEQIEAARAAGFHATSDFAEAAACDAILICVPTPLGDAHAPDLSFVQSTVEALAPHLRAGQLVVLESTTYPGTTEELVVPTLERLAFGGLRVSRNGPDAGPQTLDGLMVAFSPEREDPGNTTTPRREIPKVLGGVDAMATAAAAALYGTIFTRTVPMSSPAAAEMTKLLENIYRVVNIALVNELKQFCLKADIDIWEVIEAASTKPFGFQAFYPGPGIGGHCIPVDPFYLSWRAEQLGVATKFIELAGEVNEAMPAFVVETARRALQREGVELAGARVLLLGMAYKRDIDDLRESPALTIFDLLQRAGADVAYNDPYFATIGRGRKYDIGLSSTPLEHVGEFDCVVLVTDHSAYDVAALVAASRLFVDTRNATRGITSEKIIRC